MNEPDQREEILFQQCLELPPDEWERFLESSCSDDPELRQRLIRLVNAHQRSGGFMESLPEGNLKPFSDHLKNVSLPQESPGEQLGRYRLLELIGEGAWGTVWLAEQTEDIQRRVALKILKVGMDTRDFLARFAAERQMLAMMDHPNIAHVLDAGATPRGRPFFVMELVRGMPLLDYADSHRLSLHARLALFIPICHAVQHAHQKGIIHRDLKPSNILVALNDDEPLPKIIDFGIAKTTQYHFADKALVTGFHTFIGTPVYSSPEQLGCSDLEVDHRSDIYSLGVLLYELLCGRPPFDPELLAKQSLESMRTVIREEDPPRPSLRFSSLSLDEKATIALHRASPPPKVESRLRGELDWIVMQCLEKDRSRRYESAHALAQDLDAFMEQKPVSAAAPSAVYLTRKYIQRKQLSKVLLGALPALLLGMLALILYSRNGYISNQENPGTSLVWVNQSYHPDKSIAVLPFENLSDKEEDAFFTDGIHYDLLTHISRIEGIKSIARDAVLKYRGTSRNLASIAGELNVKTVLQGGVRRRGNQVRIHAELVDTSSGTSLWAEAYTRELTAQNVFEIQSEIALAIAEALKAVFSPEEMERMEKLPTQNLAALEAYFMGIACLTPQTTEGLVEAVAYFEEAIRLDADFAEAYALVADTHLTQINEAGFPAAEQIGKAEPLIARALELNDRSAEVYRVLAILEKYRRNFKAAEAAYQRAIDLNPNCWSCYHRYGNFSYWQLRSPEKALKLYRKAIELDPGNTGVRAELATILGGNFQRFEAREIFENLVREEPDAPRFHEGLGSQLSERFHEFDEAIKCFRQSYALDPGNPRLMRRMGFTYMHLGDFKTAIFWLERSYSQAPHGMSAPGIRAGLLYLQGDTEAAVEQYVTVTESRRHCGRAAYNIIQLAEEPDKGLEALRQWEANKPSLMGPEPFSAHDWASFMHPVLFADALMAYGQEEKADFVLKKVFQALPFEPEHRWQMIDRVVLAHALSGDIDQALSELRAYVEGGGALRFADEPTRQLTQWAVFNRLKGEPEFLELVAVMHERLAEQRTNLIRWEASGELAPIPALPAN